MKFFYIVLLLILPVIGRAQCAMCRAALESEESGEKAAAVNDGIVYLMVIPYVLVGLLGFVIYKMYYKKK